MSTLNTTSLKNQNSSTNNLILGSNGSVLFGSEGTAAEPSIAFNSDTDTGLYSPGANQLALATGGSGRLFVDSSGRVGIGTSNPNHLLDVRNTATPIQAYFIGGDLVNTNAFNTVLNLRDITFATGSGSSNTLISWTDANGNQNAYIGVNHNANYNSNGSLIFGTTSGGTVAERLRIDFSGRLLVGTSSAAGTANTSTNAQIQIEAAATYASQSIRTNSNDATPPYLSFGKSRGTTAGSNTVVANNDYLGFISFDGADGSAQKTGASIFAQVDGTPGANDMPGRLVFSTTADGASSPTERMRISSAGVLSVGTASVPSGTHTIQWQGANRCSFGNMDTTAANAYGIGILYGGGVAPNGTGNEFLYCADNAAIRATIRSNGGFANYSANDVNLSDRNTKKDVTLSPGTWDCLKEWEIVHFRYKEQPDDADLSLGVIAQQIEEHCPEVVTVFQEEQEAKEAIFDEEGNVVEPAQEAKPERIGVKEQQMMWMAIKALQEAQLRIEQLEASNSNLLTRVTALEAI